MGRKLRAARARRGPAWRVAAWLVRRARERFAAPPPAGPPGRPPARRPARDPALLRRLAGWRRRAGRAAPGLDVRMTPREAAAAMRDLEGLRAQMSDEQARRLDAQIAAGAVSVRRLRPEDGHLWEMPGMRVFAIVGVRAFTVVDEER
jgi:hypothetical protein